MPDRTQLDAMAARMIATLRNPMPSKGGGRSHTASAASPDDTPFVARSDDSRFAALERPVRIAAFTEGPAVEQRVRRGLGSGDSVGPRSWVAPHEGAHGELRADF